MNALAEDLEGNLTIASKEGTVISILFTARVTLDERKEISEPEKDYAL